MDRNWVWRALCAPLMVLAVMAGALFDAPSTGASQATAVEAVSGYSHQVEVELAASSTSVRQAVVDYAMAQVGKPYRWGGTGPNSFDCSGLTHMAYEAAGIDIPRNSRAQSQSGTPVARGSLQPGDLVFFYSPVSHVGMYIGDGMMVHASTRSKPIAVVSLSSMGGKYHSARRY